MKTDALLFYLCNCWQKYIYIYMCVCHSPFSEVQTTKPRTTEHKTTPALHGELTAARRRTWPCRGTARSGPQSSACDGLNLHYFISFFAAWNAIDTSFVFVIVLISHPAWAPDNACDRVLGQPSRAARPLTPWIGSDRQR